MIKVLSKFLTLALDSLNRTREISFIAKELGHLFVCFSGNHRLQKKKKKKKKKTGKNSLSEKPIRAT